MRLVTAENITPETHSLHRDALVQLRLALRDQQVVLDSAGVGIAVIKQRIVIRCNQRFAGIYGYAVPAECLKRISSGWRILIRSPGCQTGPCWATVASTLWALPGGPTNAWR